MMETTTELNVTAEHTDSLGHLNHVEAVRFLERARDEWLAACGLYEADTRHASVIVNIDYSYQRECFEGEHLRVMSRPVGMGTKSYVLSHEIIKATGEVAICGRATSVIMDMAERRIVPVPACMARYLAARR